MINYSLVFTWFTDHLRLSALLAGCGLGVGFVWPILQIVVIPALFLCLLLLERLDQSKLPAAFTIVFGVKALMALSWFLSAYPITWLFTITPSTQLIVVFVYWGICAVFLASAGILLSLLWRLCRRFAWRLYLVPILWVVAEYLGAVVFSILSAGPGSYITGAFSFGHIGYLFPWLTPLALYGGVYSVGVVGVLLAVIGYRYIVTRNKKIFFTTLGLVSVLLVWSSMNMTVARPEGRIVLVNTLFGNHVSTEDRAIALGSMVESALGQNGNYILLPEDARYLYQYEMPLVGAAEAIEAWKILHGTNTAMIIDSGRTTDEVSGAIVQRAFVWSSGSSIYTADKQYLVPQGEFMPSLAALALRFVGLGPVAAALTESINYTASDRVIALHADSTVPNILFCFESVSPLAAKTLVANRPSDFIFHPMSHSWFHEPKVVWRQLDTMLRFQSVYSKTPIISVGNEVQGKAYLPDGTIEIPKTVAVFPFGTINVIE